MPANAPLRITHVIVSLDTRGGGPSIALEGLSTQQAALGADVRVVGTFYPQDDDARLKRMQAAGVNVQLAGPVQTRLSSHPDLPPLIQRAVTDSDIVHIHAMWEQPQHLAARAAHQQNIPYIIRPCGMLDPWSLAQSKWKKKAFLAWRVRTNLNRAAALHFTTDTEQQLTGPLRLKAPGIIEPNGVDVDTLSAPADPALDLRQQHPALRDRPLIVFLSRLHHKKGLDVLLDAFALLQQNWPTHHHPDQPTPGLAIVGAGEPDYVNSLKQRATQLGIANQVVFTGMLIGDAKTAALQSADVFCLPSHQENFGIAVIEALASGTPVAISDQVNIFQKIADANLGSAVPVDPQAVAHQLRTWLDDHDARARVRRDAGPWTRENYGWEQIAHRWVHQHYPRLCGRTAPPTPPAP